MKPVRVRNTKTNRFFYLYWSRSTNQFGKTAKRLIAREILKKGALKAMPKGYERFYTSKQTLMFRRVAN